MASYLSYLAPQRTALKALSRTEEIRQTWSRCAWMVSASRLVDERVQSVHGRVLLEARPGTRHSGVRLRARGGLLFSGRICGRRAGQRENSPGKQQRVGKVVDPLNLHPDTR